MNEIGDGMWIGELLTVRSAGRIGIDCKKLGQFLWKRIVRLRDGDNLEKQSTNEYTGMRCEQSE